MNVRMRTKYLTVSAMLSALSVVILMLGSVVDVLDVSTAVLASLLCLYAVIEIGGVYPWMIWLVTSVLGLLLLPVKTPAIFYAFFAGFYPILRTRLERLRAPIAWVLKLVIFHVSLAVMVLVLWLFFPGSLAFEGRWLLVATYAVCVACFVVYDIALTRCITFYLIKLHHRFQIK